ncbi:MAG TPA: dihydrolipoamide acetyltransferase family protein [Gaiellaceae bacterium]|jgi:pyruvate dehydrogenase E2 component (dihydrolipoamide acetyltransferase)
MATEVKLPRLGQGMEAGTIVRWLKSEGDTVEKGEPLYELDTDKVTQEVEAEAGGVLLKIAIPEGEVAVGKTIALIGEAGEEVTEAFGEGEDEQPGAAESDEADESAEKPARAPARDAEREVGREASTEAPTEPQQQATTNGQPEANGGRVKASPLARRIARERGVDISALSGTGPEGRVVAEDVERAAASGTPTAAPARAAAPSGEVEIEKLTSLRKTIARRMAEAWQAPAFQIAMSADMSRALALRERMVAMLQEGQTKPTISDVLTKVCASALMRHRDVNALFAGDAIELHPSANIGIAVAIPKGLVVPVIQQCERKSIAEIAEARAALVERARSGKLQQADLEGGTFTISNLGMYGVERFVAVLNPPQAAILAVGAAEEKPVVRDGEVVVRPMLELTLTCDHRSLDGATAAEFLRTVKDFLEEPGLAL